MIFCNYNKTKIRNNLSKEGVSKHSALPEVDQSYVGKGIDQTDDESREFRSRDEDKPVRIAACGLRDIKKIEGHEFISYCQV